jgi:hypothetical protein
MNNIPYWLEIAIYFVMAGLCATILKYIYEIIKIIRK